MTKVIDCSCHPGGCCAGTCSLLGGGWGCPASGPVWRQTLPGVSYSMVAEDIIWLLFVIMNEPDFKPFPPSRLSQLEARLVLLKFYSFFFFWVSEWGGGTLSYRCRSGGWMRPPCSTGGCWGKRKPDFIFPIRHFLSPLCPAFTFSLPPPDQQVLPQFVAATSLPQCCHNVARPVRLHQPQVIHLAAAHQSGWTGSVIGIHINCLIVLLI